MSVELGNCPIYIQHCQLKNFICFGFMCLIVVFYVAVAHPVGSLESCGGAPSPNTGFENKVPTYNNGNNYAHYR